MSYTQPTYGSIFGNALPDYGLFEDYQTSSTTDPWEDVVESETCGPGEEWDEYLNMCTFAISESYPDEPAYVAPTSPAAGPPAAPSTSSKRSGSRSKSTSGGQTKALTPTFFEQGAPAWQKWAVYGAGTLAVGGIIWLMVRD